MASKIFEERVQYATINNTLEIACAGLRAATNELRYGDRDPAALDTAIIRVCSAASDLERVSRTIVDGLL